MSAFEPSVTDHGPYFRPAFQMLESTTEFDNEEFIFRWNLKVPSIKQILESPFESPVFVGGERLQHSWQLRWERTYRSGGMVGVEHCYRLQLVLVAIDNSNDTQGKTIQACVRVNAGKPDETELLQAQTGNKNIVLRDVRVGQVVHTLVIMETDFWNEEKGYIVNNIFTVCCTIFVSCGVQSSAVSKVYLVGSSGSISAGGFSNKTTALAPITKAAFNSTDFADVQLLTGSKSIPAHKVILAGRSRVFSAMFKSNLQEANTNCVEIKDFSVDVVVGMLEYIYTDQILSFTDETDVATAVEYLRISDKYEILEVKSQCERFLCHKVTVEDAVEILQVASLYNCAALKATVVEFIMRNKRKVCETDGFKKLGDPSILLEFFMLT